MIVDDWARSGLAALTGEATGRPDLTHAPVLARARRTLATFVDITDTSSDDRLPPLDAAEFLSGVRLSPGTPATVACPPRVPAG